MRLIDWNYEVEKQVFDDFKGNYPQLRRVRGFVVEGLIEDYYHQPVCKCDGKPDNGYDFILHGIKVDVKNDSCDFKYFDCPNTLFNINYNPKREPDEYLFVKADFLNHKLALIGYLNPTEVKMKGKHYNQGEFIPEFGMKSDYECFLVSQRDLIPINEIPTEN